MDSLEGPGWGLVEPENSGDGNRHVVPLRRVPEVRGLQPDHLAHIDQCWCAPARDPEEPTLVVHKAVSTE